MSAYLVTGASGFFGGILKRRLLALGHNVVNVDLHADEDKIPICCPFRQISGTKSECRRSLPPRSLMASST